MQQKKYHLVCSKHLSSFLKPGAYITHDAMHQLTVAVPMHGGVKWGKDQFLLSLWIFLFLLLFDKNLEEKKAEL